MMSENMDKAFFGADIPMEDEIERSDGRVERRPVGTIVLFNRWLKKKYRTKDGEDVSDEVVAVWREIRKLRQKPAHAIEIDAYDEAFAKQQDELMARATRSLTMIRLILSSHPMVKWYEPPAWLDGDSIVFY
jgi:biopolymer transport protein ExbB/TolQ